jgi:hypothetical protein
MYTESVRDDNGHEVAAIDWGEQACATVRYRTPDGWRSIDVQHLGRPRVVYATLARILGQPKL